MVGAIAFGLHGLIDLVHGSIGVLLCAEVFVRTPHTVPFVEARVLLLLPIACRKLG